jgi:alkylation response protein AidB-like acyl-CoA dehydrogenase
VNFDFTVEELAFRKELKEFLDGELPVYFEFFDLPPDERMARSSAFVKLLAARGWLTPAWPVEYGGNDQAPWQQMIVAEEMVAHGEPRTGQYMNVNWVGPAIILAGTPEQKAYHLSRISNGDVMWCQGFSEPDAGSDLAAMRTSAVRDGDEYIINGEKIWTSNAGIADFCFLLARTNSEVRKQDGISIFLVPVDTPGIEVGDIDSVLHPGAFHHVVFTDVRVPASCRLGPENEGFSIVRRLLANERTGIARYHRAAGYLDRIARWCADRDLLDDSAVVEALASARSACEAARLLVYQVYDEKTRGLHPEETAWVYRVATVRAERAVSEAAFKLMGAEGLERHSYADAQFEWAVTSGIAGGSYEMQLNSLARVLLGTKG